MSSIGSSVLNGVLIFCLFQVPKIYLNGALIAQRYFVIERCDHITKCSGFTGFPGFPGLGPVFRRREEGRRESG